MPKTAIKTKKSISKQVSSKTWNTQRRTIIALLAVLVVGIVGTITLLSSRAGSNNIRNVRIATFNMLWQGFDNQYPAHKWDMRKDAVKEIIASRDFEIFGAQEVWSDSQFNDIKRMDDSYASTAGSGDIRRNPIFFNREMFRFEDQGVFKNPGEASKYTTWALLTHRPSGNKFYVFNTHLDHDNENFKRDGARLLVEKTNNINRQRYPVVLMGDFNSFSRDDGTVYDILTRNGFSDSYFLAPRDNRYNGEYKTRHGFNKPIPTGPQRIDKVFIKPYGNNIEVHLYRTVIGRPDGEFPSDHHPVMAVFSVYY